MIGVWRHENDVFCLDLANSVTQADRSSVGNVTHRVIIYDVRYVILPIQLPISHQHLFVNYDVAL